MSSSIEVVLAQISCFGTFPGGGGWVESIIRLISAEAEAEALLGLAELGNYWLYLDNRKIVVHQ